MAVKPESWIAHNALTLALVIQIGAVCFWGGTITERIANLQFQVQQLRAEIANHAAQTDKKRTSQGHQKGFGEPQDAASILAVTAAPAGKAREVKDEFTIRGGGLRRLRGGPVVAGFPTSASASFER